MVDIKFTNQEITAFFAALTLVLTPLGELLAVLVKFTNALISLVPQCSLTLNSFSSLNNSVTGSLITPAKNLLNGIFSKYLMPDKCCKKEHECKRNHEYKKYDKCEKGEYRCKK